MELENKNGNKIKLLEEDSRIKDFEITTLKELMT